jgi:predicted aconitase
MRLTSEEQALLAGEQGPGVRKATEIVIALGKIYGADRLVPVESVQVAGVSYKNLGPAGLAFLREWAAEGGAGLCRVIRRPAESGGGCLCGDGNRNDLHLHPLPSRTGA